MNEHIYVPTDYISLPFFPREKTTEIKRKTSRLKAADYVESPFRA